MPDFTVNPEDYIIESKGPMNVVRYDHGADLGGQSLVHLTRAA